MAIETELKLRIAPEYINSIKRNPFLRSLSIGRASSHRLYSVYFDTPDLQLHHKRMALRLRRDGNNWLQTLKGGGGVKAGLHQRSEWETPVSSECLDFDAFNSIGATPLPSNLRNQLQPLFVTDFTRSIRMVKFEGAIIEMGLDSGVIRAGMSTHPISELELELKSGEPLQLFRLALALLNFFPLQIEQVSKAEYGYRLHQPVKSIITKVFKPKLDGQISVGAALQSIIWSNLFHLQANVPGAVVQLDAEYLHQIRVALRRLRVVLNITNRFNADDELDSLRTQIRELGSRLGRSREWDVFVNEILPSILQSVNQQVDNCELAAEIAKQGAFSQQLVYDSLQSSDFQRLLLRFGAWMSGGYWKSLFNSDNLLSFSNNVLERYERKVLRRGSCIDGEVNTEALHKLRIACKNLRYSAELFDFLYERQGNATRLTMLEILQNRLGKLHDSAIALQLLNELNRGAKLQNIELITDQIHLNYGNQLHALQKEWKRYLNLAEKRG